LEVHSGSNPLTLKTAALCVSFRYISWMTLKRGRGWLENASPAVMTVEELPLGPYLRRP
jgi:hypothetical protein